MANTCAVIGLFFALLAATLIAAPTVIVGWFTRSSDQATVYLALGLAASVVLLYMERIPYTSIHRRPLTYLYAMYSTRPPKLTVVLIDVEPRLAFRAKHILLMEPEFSWVLTRYYPDGAAIEAITNVESALPQRFGWQVEVVLRESGILVAPPQVSTT